MISILRAHIAHTPKSPFEHTDALELFEDGAIVFDERVLAVGEFGACRAMFPDAVVVDERGAFVLPGFVDTHVHFPQVPVIGAMGVRLLEWLAQRTLPEENRFADAGYARQQAQAFLRLLLKNGTTTALVFGAHFKDAMQVFFEEANKSGLRISSGLVLGDRHLTPELHTNAERAYQESRDLIDAWHNHGRLRYAVTPRFSLSCSESLLEVCQRLLSETPDLLFTSHINENKDEIAFVGELFPWSRDYLETYERFGLVNERAVYAHNVHVSDSELTRLANANASVSHCCSSNMFIGSGLFPLKRHLQHGVHVALGSDVGGGTGFSLFKEGLMAYQAQMLLQEKGEALTAAHLLYLATLAGAKALKLEEQIGDFIVGKQADFILLKAPQGSTLQATLQQSPDITSSLAALFTLAREESVQQVYVAGKCLLNTQA